MKFLPLIWSSLGRRKIRTLLTLLSIVVAFLLYGYLSAIGRALDQGVSMAGADRLMVRHRVSITQPLSNTCNDSAVYLMSRSAFESDPTMVAAESYPSGTSRRKVSGEKRETGYSL